MYKIVYLIFIIKQKNEFRMKSKLLDYKSKLKIKDPMYVFQRNRRKSDYDNLNEERRNLTLF